MFSIYGFDLLTLGDGPHEIGTISAPANVFGTPYDGDGAGTSSAWELQDLIHPGGEGSYGIMEILLQDSNSDTIGGDIAQSVLNYIEGGDTGGGTGPSEPTITYTHIGNTGGTSGIDDTETQYPNETTAVQFSRK